MTIIWNGNWFSILSSTTSSSNTFASFLDKLNYWLSANKIFQKKEIFVMQDKWIKLKTGKVLQKI